MKTIFDLEFYILQIHIGSDYYELKFLELELKITLLELKQKGIDLKTIEEQITLLEYELKILQYENYQLLQKFCSNTIL
ncbi:hypothetical protein JJC03_04765 [Flavobacterium oreochromis]|uniref:hypothetical protein n=1 Tax=Flavobacterium oreochromis TaxID=2906078 RepID=UPI001CE60768|nr:hypothetical protein [Flavobacterium oreochromis]QYS87210.1 hypothetical protein JJC03_04515 [Flavobacterium oreochromis]QYS87218.1 hypothetical protein JJC03_04575 [Flavobacterium oreochromis]QYS87248.1 hypothetical protein JJC03_04765 [Flavobacterium oreochromis]